MPSTIENNILCTIFRLAKCLKVRITRSAVISEIQRSPSSETLFGISTVLQKWKINNAAYQLTADELDPEYCPFIATVKNEAGLAEFVVVEEIQMDHVILSNEKWTQRSLAKERFMEIYTGAILAVEAEANAGELNYTVQRRKEILNNLRLPFLYTSVLLLMSAILAEAGAGTKNVPLILLLSIKCCGILFSALLIAKDFGPENALLKKICTFGKSSDCDSVLSSRASFLLAGISWSEIGLCYFTGTSFLLIFQHGGELIQIDAYFAALSFPYVLFSIGYQAFAIKKWCVLCCAVQLCLLAELAVILSFGYLSFSFKALSTREFITCLVSFLLPVTLWVFIKPLLRANDDLSQALKDLSRLKFNEDLFGKMLAAQRSYGHPDKAYSIVLGNPDADKIITLVSDPYCAPCSKTYKDIDQLIKEKDNLQVRVILKDSPGNDAINRHLLTLNRQSGQIAESAIADWYQGNEKDFRKWVNRYPLPEAAEEEETAFAYQKEWYKNADVPFTPFIIVNGHQLPEPYQIQDLLHLL